MKTKLLRGIAIILIVLQMLFACTACKGSAGQQGIQGVQGVQGIQGIQGIQGAQGNDGLSAFEIYRKYHPEYTGTEQEWIESLKASDGEKEDFPVELDSQWLLDNRGVVTIVPVMLDGCFINQATGAVCSASKADQYRATEFISIPNGAELVSTSYVSNGGIRSSDGYAFYNADKQYITGGRQRPANEKFEIPKDAEYVAFTDYSSAEHINQTVTFEKNVQKTTKVVAMFGDSITWGRVGGASGSVQTENTFSKALEEKTGYYVINYGVGSQGWVTQSPDGNNAYANIASKDLLNVDVVTLQYGTNDSSQPLGTIDDTEGTILGEMYRCVDYIMKINPSITVIIIGQINAKYGEFPHYNAEIVENRYSQFEAFCNKYHLIWIDTIHHSPINAFNIQTMIGDNVHPSEEGYKILSPFIAGQIAQYI